MVDGGDVKMAIMMMRRMMISTMIVKRIRGKINVLHPPRAPSLSHSSLAMWASPGSVTVRNCSLNNTFHTHQDVGVGCCCLTASWSPCPPPAR